MGSKDIGEEIKGIVVSNKFAFLITTESNKEFQVWNISNPPNIFNVSKFNYSQKTTGIDYEDNIIYVSNESNDALRIIYSP